MPTRQRGVAVADYSRPNAQMVEGRGLVVRASAVGRCQTQLVWDIQSSMGLLDHAPSPPPIQMQEAMDESAALEQQAIDLLSDNNHAPIMAVSTTLERQVAPDMWLTGTPDATDGTNIWEIKCMGGKLYEEFIEGEPWDSYYMQCGSYALLTGKPVYLAIFEKHQGGLTGKWFVREVPFKWQEQVLAAMNELNQVDLNADHTCPGQSGWCPWESRHSRPALNHQATSAYLKWQQTKAEVAMLTKRLNEQKAIVESFVQDQGGKCQVQTSDGLVKLTWVETHIVEDKPREYDRKYLNVSKPKPAT